MYHNSSYFSLLLASSFPSNTTKTNHNKNTTKYIYVCVIIVDAFVHVSVCVRACVEWISALSFQFH